ncbi:MAG: bifunctional adenosylcobinamide kinase/adenosylcobinamide-phosphate guanylyltransferase, partial [Dehalococcoidia bacterium]
MGELIVVLGGARSGKSGVAQRLAGNQAGAVVYVATAEVSDPEMAARIERHRNDRPAGWRTIESPQGLDSRIAAEARDWETVVIDCLSVWLSNELLSQEPSLLPGGQTADPGVAEPAEAELVARVQRLADWALARQGMTIVVSNEVGSGVVPAYPLGRLYRDLLGRANQAVAASASRVFFVVAGIAVDLKQFEAGLGSRRG